MLKDVVNITRTIYANPSQLTKFFKATREIHTKYIQDHH